MVPNADGANSIFSAFEAMQTRENGLKSSFCFLETWTTFNADAMQRIDLESFVHTHVVVPQRDVVGIEFTATPREDIVVIIDDVRFFVTCEKRQKCDERREYNALSARSFSILKTSTISSIRSHGNEESVSSILCDFGQKLVHFF